MSISAAAAAAKSLQSCLSLRPHRWAATRLLRPWDSPGKNIGVGCHFLLQCMKVKSESEVAQWCPTLSDPKECSLPGSSVLGILQARALEWGAIAFSVSVSTHLKSLRNLLGGDEYYTAPYKMTGFRNDTQLPGWVTLLQYVVFWHRWLKLYDVWIFIRLEGILMDSSAYDLERGSKNIWLAQGYWTSASLSF